VNEYVYPFALQNFARVVSLSLLNKPRFRYLRSSSWVELKTLSNYSYPHYFPLYHYHYKIQQFIIISCLKIVKAENNAKNYLFSMINRFLDIQLTLVISNSMGPWKTFESTVVRLMRSYEDTGSVVCLTTKGRQLERNFEELKPASHVPLNYNFIIFYRLL
jgi:hypothetical protein